MRHVQGRGRWRRHNGLLRAAGLLKKPLIILVGMEISGLHECLKDIMPGRSFGAFAVAPNNYFRYETNGVHLTKTEYIQKPLPIVKRKTDTELMPMSRTVAWQRLGRRRSRLGIMGFCRG